MIRRRRPSRSFKRFFTWVATKFLVARLPPLPIEVTRHRQGFVALVGVGVGADAFALLRTVRFVFGISGLAMPIEARKLTVVIFNVDAVARTALLDKPVTADIASDEYRMFLANTVRRDVISIPPIRQSSATVTAIDTPIHAEVVFIRVRARGHAHAVFDVPAPAVRPAVMLAHPVQVLAPAKGVFS